ncbi:MAG TPA: zf-HC2 domain-containing protein [Kofleriaceae bacterium]|nr:zf-HC2 domain-containing protein [Kofleriaceae bacterium]
MSACEHVRAELTAYLDGELDETSASSLRGHLRLCVECRALADQHARIVDVLAALPPPEPPPSMWDGVKARLGAAEIEDARRSRLGLWWQRVRPHLVPAMGLAAAAAVAAVWIAHRRASGDEPAHEVAIGHHEVTPPVPPSPPVAPSAADQIDVRDALASDDDHADAAYRAAAEELIAMAADAKGDWTPSQQKAFDARVAALRTAAEHAASGEPRERAWQALIDYVQRAVVGVRVAEAL